MAFDIPGLGPNAEEAIRDLIKGAGDTAEVSTEIVSAGGTITIPAGITVAAALQIIIDALDP